MNKIVEKLLEDINKVLTQKPLFYFSRDVERSLGLENLLDNYDIAAVESSYISDQLKLTTNNKVFISQDSGDALKSDSTLELVKLSSVQEWVKRSAPKGFYAQFFQFNQPSVSVIESLGGTVLNNHAELNRKFESKISQLKIFQENGIPSANAFIVNISETNFAGVLSKLGNKVSKIVIQEDRAHTGSGTYFISNHDEFVLLQEQLKGNNVKVSEFIEGEPYTVNGCVTKYGIFVAGIQYQITGIPELTHGKGTTIGNDWSYGYKSLSEKIRRKVEEVTKNIGEMMKKENFKGLFGIDFIVKKDEIFVVEINARQTANIPLQTKLELAQDQIPLALISLSEWLGIDYNLKPTEVPLVEGSQIFLRAKKDNVVVNEQVRSGVFRLQSDNAAVKKMMDQGPWIMDQVLFIDEEQDKPLIWQKDGYCIDYIDEGGFILLVQKKGSVRNKFDEVARMQFTNQIIFDGAKVSPWVIEAMKAIEERIR